MKKNALQKSAEFMYNQYALDPDMMEICYKIEYGEFEYNEKFSSIRRGKS